MEKCVVRLVQHKIGATTGDGYSASVAGSRAIKLAILILALAAGLTAPVGRNDLYVVVKGVAVQTVLADGQPSLTAAETSADNHRRPVAPPSIRRTPGATLLEIDASIVDIVLGRARLSEPVVAGVSLRNRQGLCGTGSASQWDNHVLGTGIVRAADGDKLVESIHNRRSTLSFLAELGEVRAGEPKLSVLAQQTPTTLSIGGLIVGPLGLAVASGAGVGAVSALRALPNVVAVSVSDLDS